MRQAEDRYTADMLASRKVQMPSTGRGPYQVMKAPRSFGSYVAHLRACRNLTQVQYAELVGISRRSLIMIERLEQIPRHIDYWGSVFKVAMHEFGCSVQGPRVQIRNSFAAWKGQAQ